MIHAITRRSVDLEKIDIEEALLDYSLYDDLVNYTNISIGYEKTVIFKLLSCLIKNLPSDLYEFFNLRYKKSLTMEETAERMSISLSTCYRYRRRLLKKINRVLNCLN